MTAPAKTHIDIKVAIGLFADILYDKGLLCFEEMDALLNISSAEDAYAFSDKLLRGEFNVYKRGEIYLESLAKSAE
jgi:hypothetical protein